MDYKSKVMQLLNALRMNDSPQFQQPNQPMPQPPLNLDQIQLDQNGQPFVGQPPMMPQQPQQPIQRPPMQPSIDDLIAMETQRRQRFAQ